MKEILAMLGQLVTYKKLNRDNLAECVGMTQPNLISAFKGRRPLPAAYMPQLRRALGLDDDYRFAHDQAHGLTVNAGKNPQDFLHSFQNVLQRFVSWPVYGKWLLRGIGEGNRSGFAYVFEDSRGALIAVRNDDALLGASHNAGNDVLKAGIDVGDVNAALFSRADGSPEREITLDAFNSLFTDDMSMSVETLRATLVGTVRVWTWTRLREKAEQAGLNAESAARALRLAGGTSD